MLVFPFPFPLSFFEYGKVQPPVRVKKLSTFCPKHTLTTSSLTSIQRLSLLSNPKQTKPRSNFGFLLLKMFNAKPLLKTPEECCPITSSNRSSGKSCNDAVISFSPTESSSPVSKLNSYQRGNCETECEVRGARCEVDAEPRRDVIYHNASRITHHTSSSLFASSLSSLTLTTNCLEHFETHPNSRLSYPPPPTR